MKRIGLVGGIGPESTLDYYRRLTAAFAARPDRPELVVYSARMEELLDLVAARDWDGLTGWLVAKLEALRAAGAELAAITANTPHVVFERVRDRAPIPVRSIVEAARDHARRTGARRLGLLGTGFTMSSDFYARCFEPAGMEIVAPEPAERDLIHHRLMTEIELGVFKESTRAELLGIAARLVAERGADAIILGCTELPLVLDRGEYALGPVQRPTPFLDTTAIHVADLVRAAE